MSGEPLWRLAPGRRDELKAGQLEAPRAANGANGANGAGGALEGRGCGFQFSGFAFL